MDFFVLSHKLLRNYLGITQELLRLLIIWILARYAAGHRSSTYQYDVVRTPYDIVCQTYRDDVVFNIAHTISYVRYYIRSCTYDIVRLSTVVTSIWNLALYISNLKAAGSAYSAYFFKDYIFCIFRIFYCIFCIFQATHQAGQRVRPDSVVNWQKG